MACVGKVGLCAPKAGDRTPLKIAWERGYCTVRCCAWGHAKLAENDRRPVHWMIRKLTVPLNFIMNLIAAQGNHARKIHSLTCRTGEPATGEKRGSPERSGGVPQDVHYMSRRCRQCCALFRDAALKSLRIATHASFAALCRLKVSPVWIRSPEELMTVTRFLLCLNPAGLSMTM